MFNPDDFIEETSSKSQQDRITIRAQDEVDCWLKKIAKLEKEIEEIEPEHRLFYEKKLEVFKRAKEMAVIQKKNASVTGKGDIKSYKFLGRKFSDFAKKKKWIKTSP